MYLVESMEYRGGTEYVRFWSLMLFKGEKMSSEIGLNTNMERFGKRCPPKQLTSEIEKNQKRTTGIGESTKTTIAALCRESAGQSHDCLGRLDKVYGQWTFWILCHQQNVT